MKILYQCLCPIYVEFQRHRVWVHYPCSIEKPFCSKPSVRTNVVTKPSSKRAAKLSLPVEYDVVRDPSHSDPLQGYKRTWRYKYDASELDFATPTSCEPVSRGALFYSQKAE